MNKLRYVVFDFDGTLVDSEKFGTEIARNAAIRLGYGYFSDTDIEGFKRTSKKELMKKFNLSTYRLVKLVQEMRRELAQRLEELNYFEGIDKLLLDLKAKSHKFAVVTLNSRENVDTYFKIKGLSTPAFVYQANAIFGKKLSLRAMLWKKWLKPEHVLYVGDEEGDIIACKSVGIPVVAVTWGFKRRELLASYNPEYIVDSVEELDSLLTELLS